MKYIIITSIVVMLLSLLAVAHEEETFTLGEDIIKQNLPCEELTEDQLELIGEYYMEKMHPGELHERMDQMMGGEGSAQLQQVHMNIAKMFYCGERGAMSSGMMNTMMNRGGGGMMGMMNSFGMMGWSGYGGIVMLLYTLILIGVLVLLYLWIIKLWRETSRRR